MRKKYKFDLDPPRLVNYRLSAAFRIKTIISLGAGARSRQTIDVRMKRDGETFTDSTKLEQVFTDFSLLFGEIFT